MKTQIDHITAQGNRAVRDFSHPKYREIFPDDYGQYAGTPSKEVNAIGKVILEENPEYITITIRGMLLKLLKTDEVQDKKHHVGIYECNLTKEQSIAIHDPLFEVARFATSWTSKLVMCGAVASINYYNRNVQFCSFPISPECIHIEE